MDITKLPFNEFIGLIRAEREGAMLQLPADPRYTNHLGTVHASVLMALAEACSGQALLNALADIQDSLVPMVRRFECKFRKPARGAVSGTAHLSGESVRALRAALQAKGRAIIEVTVDIHDESMTHVLSATAEWFIALRSDA